MTNIMNLEEAMKKDQVYIDSEGRRWVTSSRIAEIWNEITGHKANYTRWSVYQRRNALEKMSTPLGDLYLESGAWTVKLRPHPARPDVASANRRRKKNEFSKSPENSP